MGLFSFLKKESTMSCGWCGSAVESANIVKYVGTKRYVFCSLDCKKSFRNAGLGKEQASCPSCKLK